MSSFQLRTLRKAARILGGEQRLRAVLDAPPGAFARWMQGAERLPVPVLLAVLDFLADMESGVSFILPLDGGLIGGRRDAALSDESRSRGDREAAHRGA